MRSGATARFHSRNSYNSTINRNYDFGECRWFGNFQNTPPRHVGLQQEQQWYAKLNVAQEEFERPECERDAYLQGHHQGELGGCEVLGNMLS